MNDRSLLLSRDEITHYFKKWTTGNGVLKKIYFLYKNVILQIDALPKEYPERTLRSKVLRKRSYLEKVAVPKVTLVSAIVFNCSSKIFTILYE